MVGSVKLSEKERGMLLRQAKIIFFCCFKPLMKMNGFFYKYFRFNSKKRGEVKVQLGPGQRNYMNGWINLDANMFTGKCDVWVDLRNPLPFKDNTVDCFYSHHVIEHLPNIQFHVNEVFRCLKSGGVYRVGGPNGDSAIARFNENNYEWFTDFPDKRNSIGGRFENFIFCRGEHLSILTFSFLEELLKNSGFINITLRKPVKETGYPKWFAPCYL